MLEKVQTSVEIDESNWPVYTKISAKLIKMTETFKTTPGFHTRPHVITHVRTQSAADDESDFGPSCLKLLHLMVSELARSLKLTKTQVKAIFR